MNANLAGMWTTQNMHTLNSSKMARKEKNSKFCKFLDKSYQKLFAECEQLKKIVSQVPFIKYYIPFEQ